MDLIAPPCHSLMEDLLADGDRGVVEVSWLLGPDH